jgi:hypothetical protein
VESRLGKLQMITDSIGVKIFMVSEDIMKPLLGSNTESKNEKQQAAYKSSYGLVFTHIHLYYLQK